MGGPFVSTVARWGAFAALSAVVTVTGRARPVPADIDHLLLLVFDQMRPDYVDRFNLQHFKQVRAESRDYPAAYVGHLGSQTVVSHLVIPTGLLPRELPWQDNVMVDARGVLGKADAVYDTLRLTREQVPGRCSRRCRLVRSFRRDFGKRPGRRSSPLGRKTIRRRCSARLRPTQL